MSMSHHATCKTGITPVKKRELTEHEMTVMASLIGGREKYALEIIRETGDVLNRNTIYTVLTRMVSRGYLTARDETYEERPEKGPRRVFYKVTAYGQQMYEATAAAQAAFAQAARGVRKPAWAR